MKYKQCRVCFLEYPAELAECPECGAWRSRALRCPDCPAAWLDEQLDTPRGRLLRRALDLQFFAQQHMAIVEPTAEEAAVIRMVETERSKLEEAERKRREMEAKAAR